MLYSSMPISLLHNLQSMILQINGCRFFLVKNRFPKIDFHQESPSGFRSSPENSLSDLDPQQYWYRFSRSCSSLRICKKNANLCILLRMQDIQIFGNRSQNFTFLCQHILVTHIKGQDALFEDNYVQHLLSELKITA